MRKTGIKPEKPEDTDQVEKKNSVTVQYLHSYEPKNMPKRLAGYCLLNSYKTVTKNRKKTGETTCV